MIKAVKVTAPRLDFQDLMLYRVYEILLVASPYDAFVLEEGGRLTEQILQEYHGMNFNYPPRVWHRQSGKQALELLKKRKIDLILLMTRISDIDPLELATQIKNLYQKKPVFLLAFDQSEINDLLDVQLLESLPLDNIFLWNGHADVLLAIIKYIEDKRNASRDINRGHVRAIIFVEDTPKYYSAILPLIYKEIMYNTTQLYSKTETISNRLLHLRARPKILFATTYEGARKYFDKYRQHILGVISDIRFSKDGVVDPLAGLKFTKYIRSKDATMPIMLQSTDVNRQQEAFDANAAFLNKLSSTLHKDVREFVLSNFGFGNFVFRLPNGDVVNEVSSIIELLEILPSIPDESIRYHANSNHFSNWLAARGEFDMATAIRMMSEDDFEDQTQRKNFYINLIQSSLSKETLQDEQKIDRVKGDLPDITRSGSGSMGGKARGLVFINSVIKNSSIHGKYKNVTIRIPNITLIGTDEFDQFMDSNNLWELALSHSENEVIIQAFLAAELTAKLKSDLWIFTSKISYPVSVRSSSILEDSQYRPLAGFYSTYMIPNNQSSQEERFQVLCEAIKRVYASIYFQVPKSYSDKSSFRHDEEKMGIIIMELIGQTFDNKFYPVLSGTAQSINYYPVSYMKRDEGIATIALGFGRTVAEGEKALRFSPTYPQILPQFYSVKSTLENSQIKFYALPLDDTINPLSRGEKGNLVLYPLEDAEKDGTLVWAGSVVSAEDNIIRDSLSYDGPRVITFAHILKYSQFPLADIIMDILAIGKDAIGSPVEIEFAVNLFKDKKQKPEFCLLQIKPMVLNTLGVRQEAGTYDYTSVVARSTAALGNGKIEGINHVVLVDPLTFDAAKTKVIAKEIEEINEQIGSQDSYLLIGPGRWGTADPWLGVPVRWNQISKARVIIEVGLEDYPIDPSFGSHFFQNVTSMRIGYFTINHKSKEDMIALDWFRSHTIIDQKKFTSLLKLDEPLFIEIDGSSGMGNILKPLVRTEESMNEEESPGI